MKKLLLFIVAMAMIGLNQTFSQEIMFGAKAGINFANIVGDDADDVSMTTKFHFGVVAEIPLSDKFSVQPELIYSAQGGKFEETFSESGFTYNEEDTYKFNYLNLPIMAKYYFANGFSLEVGPQIGFLLSAKVDYDYSETFEGETYSESGEEDIKDDLKSIDFGLNFGLGYKLDNGLNFTARYNVGLTKLDDTDMDMDVKNSVIQISVGYFFL